VCADGVGELLNVLAVGVETGPGVEIDE